MMVGRCWRSPVRHYGSVVHYQTRDLVNVKKSIVCDCPMTKKCKSTVLLMGGIHSPN
ncbi:hypothetical protein ZWY2020_034535, partial [Hordeum vulgare]